MNLKTVFFGLFCVLSITSSVFAQIQPGRAVQITISGVPAEEKGRFESIYPVSEAGTINMPFIGQVRAAGLRAEQLAESLQAHYKAAGIYNNPTFQVIDTSSKTIEQQVVHVGGQVRGTGPKPWNRTLTLWQAIQAAGGPTEFGSMNRVRLTRKGSMKTYDCTKSQFQQVPLEPDDAIDVPEKNWIGH